MERNGLLILLLQKLLRTTKDLLTRRMAFLEGCPRSENDTLPAIAQARLLALPRSLPLQPEIL